MNDQIMCEAHAVRPHGMTSTVVEVADGVVIKVVNPFPSGKKRGGRLGFRHGQAADTTVTAHAHNDATVCSCRSTGGQRASLTKRRSEHDERAHTGVVRLDEQMCRAGKPLIEGHIFMHEVGRRPPASMSLARVVLPERVGHGVLRALLDCHDACRHGCLPAPSSRAACCSARARDGLLNR